MTAFGFNTPFYEQIEFLRRKLDLPSERWDDIKKSAHDRGFIVAGAGVADLVSDFHQAIIKAAAQGTGLESFRNDFWSIVQKRGWHGWTGEGSRAGEAWRTKVIYQTNMATSYAAGRYKQLTDPDFLKLRPYWRYVHEDSVLHPRPLHALWGRTRLTLRHDDPFWQTHFPPNGWGCHCRVTPVDAPGDGDATQPPEGYGERDSKGNIPGVDRGFDYAPGASVHRPLKDFIDQKLINLDAPIGAAMYEAIRPVLQEETRAAWGEWLDDVMADPVKRGRVQVVGALSQSSLDWLNAEKAIQPATAEVSVMDSLVVGKKAERHVKIGDALTDTDWRRLPDIIAEPEKVLYDNRSGKLLFVADGADDSGRQVKLALEFDFLLKKDKGQTNLIVSAFKTPAAGIDGGIKGGVYEVLR